jgi:hypothetical protein
MGIMAVQLGRRLLVKVLKSKRTAILVEEGFRIEELNDHDRHRSAILVDGEYVSMKITVARWMRGSTRASARLPISARANLMLIGPVRYGFLP